jgi:hypothetical protein
MKSLTNSEIPSSNPLYEACSGFQVAICYCELPMILKIVLKAGHDMYKSTLYTGENQPGTILMRLSEQSLDLVLFLKK